MPHGKGYRTIAKDSKSRKAPSNATKKKESEQPTPKPSTINSLPLELQQSLLNIFNYTFPHLLNPAATQDVLKPLLQTLKGHLYDRDFAAAFGSKEYLEAYAARWSPSRALGYVDILKEAIEHLHMRQTIGDKDNPDSIVQVICLGGGAGAEIVSLVGAHILLHNEERQKKQAGEAHNLNFQADHEVHRNDTITTLPPASPIPSTSLNFVVTLVDIADWSDISNSLHTALTTPPQLSPYASESARAAAKALISPSQFQARFVQQDIISPECPIASLIPSSSRASQTPSQTLVTLMFTLNELYATSVPQTQRLLLSLTMALQPGALLLVVDSPGSYSTVTVNSSEKRYPMLWLLDHTLFTSAPNTIAKLDSDDSKTGMAKLKKDMENEPRACWERVVSEESKWFRLPEGLSYPIELENMRFQMHLYRRL